MFPDFSHDKGLVKNAV